MMRFPLYLLAVPLCQAVFVKESFAASENIISKCTKIILCIIIISIVNITSKVNLCLLTCSGIVSTIGVLMKPGQIAFTRIPNFPNSLAADFVKPITPAFEAE